MADVQEIQQTNNSDTTRGKSQKSSVSTKTYTMPSGLHVILKKHIKRRQHSQKKVNPEVCQANDLPSQGSGTYNKKENEKKTYNANVTQQELNNMKLDEVMCRKNNEKVKSYICLSVPANLTYTP